MTIWKNCYTESQDHLEFYIGDNGDKPRGVAGTTFRDKKLRVIKANFPEKDKKTIRFDSDLYMEFPERTPLYKSFICVPIIGDENNSLGVLSIDSPKREAFDSEEIKEIVVLLSKLIANILIVAKDSDQGRDTSPLVT